ncbi:MAG: sugar ABC transporter permease [Actinobacteria bacterium]|nr:sugar ABC transporter permease [Actinomycetota bacterium]
MRRNQWKIAVLFLLPYIVIFSVFRFVPSVGGLLVSFFKWSLGGNPKFIGVDNYVNLAQDSSFYVAIKNTLAFFVLTVPVLVVASLLLAMLLNQKLAGRKVMRTISIIPYVLIPSIVGIMWNWIYDNNFGLLNYYIKKLGGGPVFWLTNERFALVAVSIVVVWTYIGYDMILFLAGLQGIPKETYEAAEVDGASRMQVFWHITLPLLKPVTMMVSTLTLVNVVQLFDQIYVMTNGGPGTSTLTMVQYMYTSAFTNYELGYGSAIEVVILLLLMVLITVQNRIGNRERKTA